MKNLLTATLPALSLLALGGCATTGAITSTENDGVYYSSKDHTVAAAPAPNRYYRDDTPSAQATAPAAENANPDYQGGTAQSGTTGSSDYYDDSYNSVSPSGFGQEYTGPGVSVYNYTPAWSASPSFFGSPFGYGTALSVGYGYGGFSPYSYGFGGFGYPYSGFYDPFYSPWGYGSGLSIGFGSPFYGGFGGFGYPYSPFAYRGYGYPYGGGYYGNYYGGGGYYNRPVIYANGNRSGAGENPILVGPRGRRGGTVLNSAAASAPNGAYANPVNIGNGRRGGGAVMPNGLATPGGTPNYNAPQGSSAPQSVGRNGWRSGNFGGGELVGQPANANPAAGQPAVVPSQGQSTGGRRGGFFREMFNNGGGAGNANTNAGNANNDMQMQRRSYSQPGGQPSYQQQRGSFNQPSQPSRSFEQRSYSQPSPQRSFGGGGGNFGGGGGGNFGGGGGGGRRGR